jgi:arylsulfatase A
MRRSSAPRRASVADRVATEAASRRSPGEEIPLVHRPPDHRLPAHRWLVRRLLVAVAVCCGVAGRSAAEARAATAVPPNVVIILADDLGWSDLVCYGNRFHETPRIDRLAREGMRFTQFYAGPVCSPTRANLQTGLDQARFGITQHIPGHRRPFARLRDPVVPSHLPTAATTFAERLAAAGYATGYLGKWHLGGAEHGPATQGWQEVLECNGNVQPPAVTGADGPRRTAAFLAERAVAFIETHRDRPFVLQVSHAAVHIPLSTTPERLARYRARPPVPGFPSRPEYAGLVEELDASVGTVVDAIDRLGIADRTLVLFLSDNGGLEHEQNGTVVTSNAPLRGEKGTLYEGGIRVPAIARWPGHVPAATTCSVPCTTHDLAPTVAALGGAPLAPTEPCDGMSLVALLADPTAAPPRDTLCWHLPHYHHATPAGAIRRGDWKLIEWFEDGRLELYDLANDPAESTDRSALETAMAGELRAALAAWRDDVGARMPTPNPDHDPARAEDLARPRSRRVAMQGDAWRIVDIQHADDTVTFATAADAVRLTVRSPRGIGRCTIAAPGGRWPRAVSLLLEGFKELEDFELLAPHVRAQGCRRDTGAVPRFEPPVGDVSTPRPAVTTLDIGIEVTSAGILVTLPPDLLHAAGGEPVTFRWVDWLRR